MNKQFYAIRETSSNFEEGDFTASEDWQLFYSWKND